MIVSDMQLLDSVGKEQEDDAFAEIVRRHVNLVYGSALRQVCSPQLAEEVTQSVFLELANQADRLSADTILAAWLYKVTYRVSLNCLRGEIRRHAREQAAFEMNAMDDSPTNWKEIEPLLDEGMRLLDESDRAAVLLRYFENKSLREVGQYFGASEDAAQKRVSRSVGRLREFFKKRGISIATAGLVAMIAENAAQAAPAGLPAVIASAATFGKTIASPGAGLAAATKAIAMTTLKKIAAATILLLLCGGGAVLVSAKTNGSKLNEKLTLNLDDYAGRFEMPDHKIEIKRKGNGLAVNIDGNEAFLAYPKSAEAFASHDHNSLTEMKFVRDVSGGVAQFTLVRDGRKLGDLKRARY